LSGGAPVPGGSLRGGESHVGRRERRGPVQDHRDEGVHQDRQHARANQGGDIGGSMTPSRWPISTRAISSGNVVAVMNVISTRRRAGRARR
jgi:hypothetical protein